MMHAFSEWRGEEDVDFESRMLVVRVKRIHKDRRGERECSISVDVAGPQRRRCDKAHFLKPLLSGSTVLTFAWSDHVCVTWASQQAPVLSCICCRRICDDRPERGGAELASLLSSIPHDKLMLETDAPYLVPRTIKPNKARPSRNEPALLSHVLQ
eukprot:scaffold64527_cov19-Tisochrysis_lutea.AAC.1